ncbi:hypothetical protein DCO58_07395 [Helicobacter saguini]|uniref:Uncharacterized protein n=1 Tax=Helicobacter saguini TaxID=1548018 RepID=A0A347VNA3_9HELI|nr:phosphopantothenoylcysteine decarboxylase [Helicobacter saguini]MWV61842.1 hypothetical protein [Helicobacter saguini]MWV67483.1 hypothetical protein [Helicobacter saguini]MWV69834.1 hypothetical protein [Helicobacter saguini]MWV72948.1 hypothetical protein [Helicobacter saguini]TLD95668.1 hypothetical protein LS64_002115 [Helicobacter saguini]
MIENVLNGKKVLIFVSGSIAIYKTLEVIRILRKNGAFVRIIATKNALKFINPITFEALSGTTLLHDDNESWSLDSINFSHIKHCETSTLKNSKNNNFIESSFKDSNIPNFIESNIQDSITIPPNHISYAKWADIALFAPITANSISKLANAIADNIYLSAALALRNIPKLLAPAANTFMLHNKITQEKLDKLKVLDYKVIESKSDILACGDMGDGAMASIDEIIFHIKKAIYNFYPIPIFESSKIPNFFSHINLFGHVECSEKSTLKNSKNHNFIESNPKDSIQKNSNINNFIDYNILNSKTLSQFYKDKNVIITAGGSSEDIDDIRCISNHSSGLQGANLALALFFLGAKVTLITSNIPFTLPLNIKTILVKTSKNYKDSINEVLDSIDSSHIKQCKISNIESNNKIFLFMVAAISDYIPQKVSGKIKKDSVGSELNLTLTQNIDILKSLDLRKDSKNLVKIAFKAETDNKNALQHAQNALIAKNCRAICLNIINKKNKAFGEATNEIYFITKNTESNPQDFKNIESKTNKDSKDFNNPKTLDSKPQTFTQTKLTASKFTISMQILSLLQISLEF